MLLPSTSPLYSWQRLAALGKSAAHRKEVTLRAAALCLAFPCRATVLHITLRYCNWLLLRRLPALWVCVSADLHAVRLAFDYILPAHVGPDLGTVPKHQESTLREGWWPGKRPIESESSVHTCPQYRRPACVDRPTD